MHRPAGEGGEAGSEDHTGVGQFRVGNHTIGYQLFDTVDKWRDQPLGQSGRDAARCRLGGLA